MKKLNLLSIETFKNKLVKATNNLSSTQLKKIKGGTGDNDCDGQIDDGL